MTARVIMQTPDIHRVLTRIAHEILESNRGTDNLVLLGIPTRGVTLAHRLVSILETIVPGNTRRACLPPRMSP